MAINLGDFVTIVKRQGRYGDPAVTNDTPTSDILSSINLRGASIWSAADWKWAREELAFAVVPGTVRYSVNAKSGNGFDRILVLVPLDTTVSPVINGDPLDHLEVREFYSTCDQVGAPAAVPEKYTTVGQDAANEWNIILWPSPSSAFTMAGWAKALRQTFTAADIVANTAFTYFPDDMVLDSLLAGVLIDVGRIQGDTAEQTLAKDSLWDRKIRKLAGQQVGADRDNSPLTSQAPDRVVRRMNSRCNRGTKVF